MTSLPPIDKQLVLELEGGVAIPEAGDVLPGGRGLRLTLPVYQDLANCSGQPGACVARSGAGWAAP